MITFDRLGKSFGARVLFEDASLLMTSGHRYGVVGANGSGKSTLLRMISGDEPVSDGAISIPKKARVGVLRQDRFVRDDEIILDIAKRGDEPAYEALERQRALLAEAMPDPALVAEAEDRIRDLDGYTLEARASAVLAGLGIEVGLHKEPLSVLSGGYKLRVLLGQVLVGHPEVLLLDEPTNHLDILTIRWLETFLADYRGCALIVSHDQRFLDNVATNILDLDYGTITVYPGNFSAFCAQKEQTRAQKAAELARIEREIADKKAFVERFRAKATKARQAQSRLKQIEKIETDLELPEETSRRTPVLSFSQRRPSGKDVLTVRDLHKAYGDNEVLRGVSMLVRRGERVAIIGANGLGKSTLVRILAGRLEPDGGEVTWGHEVAAGYFPQDHREVLSDPDATPLDHVWAGCPSEGTSYVRGKLGQVLLGGDDVYKKVSMLSGGEAARVLFGRLMVDKPNVLLLDEPTNHLDLESIGALVEALLAYEGTLLFVSHDRWFVSALATRIVEIRADGITDFPGTYEDYLSHAHADHLDADAVVLRQRRARAAEHGEAEGKESWQDQKRRRNRVKELTQRRDRLTSDIDAAERRRAEVRARYCEEGFYAPSNAAEASALHEEERSLDQRIEALLAEWEAVELELGELG